MAQLPRSFLHANLFQTQRAVDAKELPKGVLFATSGLGGALGWAIIHPACTLSVRMNLASMQGRPFAFGQMLSESGWMSLYDGLSAGIARQLVYSTARLGLFEIVRDKLQEYRGGGEADFASRAMVGATTGGVAAYISCPAEVAVVRMANDSSLPLLERRNYKNVLDTASRIVHEEGFATFWRGSGPLVTRAMIVGVFQVATLDQFKSSFADRFHQKKNSIPNVFCSAMSAGLVYSLVTQPLEACKNRMASQKPDGVTGRLPYRSFAQTVHKVTSEEGFSALYRGFLPYYVRCGGHTVIMFVLVQVLRDLYCSTAAGLRRREKRNK